MSEIKLISIEDIVNENYQLTGVKYYKRREKLVGVCCSSFYYYGTVHEQITRIVVILIKVHFFLDGNKRTALSTYIVISQADGIKYIEDVQEQIAAFIEIATTHKDISDYVKLLFP